VLLSRAWDVVYIRPHPNPHSSSRMSITEEQQAALRFIAAAPRGVSLSTMMARGFSFEMLQGVGTRWPGDYAARRHQCW
jgi:hypothetical protein